MFPLGKVNSAYDALNLPRNASIQEVLERSHQLESRLLSSGNSERLEEIRSAVDIIRSVEAAASEERDLQRVKQKSKSERELDGQLRAIEKDKRLDTEEPSPKRIKTETAKKETAEEVPETTKEESNVQSTEKVRDMFSKLHPLLRDESKFLRALNVLSNIVKAWSFTEKSDLLVESVELAFSASGGIPFINSNEDNRRASMSLLNAIEENSKLDVCKETALVWRHVIRFRNSLFEMDNFNFSKRCAEIIELTQKMTENDERMLQEILVTIKVLVSKPVSKLIPGRVPEVKSTMTELFKISRTLPQFFVDGVALLQREFNSI